MFVIQDICGLTDDWLVDEYVPGIKNRLGAGVARVLGRALLWVANDNELQHLVPDRLLTLLRERYEAVRMLPEDENPVKKIELIVYSVAGQLKIDPAGGLDGGGNDDNRDLAARSDLNPQPLNHPAFQALLAQNNAIRLAISEILTNQRTINEATQNKLAQVQRMI